jgi:hypothetical protein
MISRMCSSNWKCPQKFKKTKITNEIYPKIQNLTKLEQRVLNNVAKHHQKNGEKN